MQLDGDGTKLSARRDLALSLVLFMPSISKLEPRAAGSCRSWARSLAMLLSALVDRLAQPLRVHTRCVGYAMPPARLSIHIANWRESVSFLSTCVSRAGCTGVGPSRDSSNPQRCICHVEAFGLFLVGAKREGGEREREEVHPKQSYRRTYKKCFLVS